MTSTTCDAAPLQRDADWQLLLQRIPADLETSAFAELALFRKRRIPHAATLLRLILAYACGLSMPLVTAWAAARGLATLTPEALHGRIKAAHRWLEVLVVQCLATHAQAGALLNVPLCLRVIDGTQTTRPGATGTDWRCHLSLDLQTQRLTAAKVTPDTIGESFTRFTCQPGDVLLGDRNFGTRNNLWHVVQAGADALVRVIWRNLPLQTPTGAPFALWDHLAGVASGTAQEWAVQTAPGRDLPALPGRLIAYRLTPAEAARARQRHLRRRSRSREGVPQPATVAGWEYVLLFTTLSAPVVSTAQVLALYRFRWQIEMAIKRYKSLCGLARLRTRLTASCRTVLWAKLLLILLVEDLGATTEAFSP